MMLHAESHPDDTPGGAAREALRHRLPGRQTLAKLFRFGISGVIATGIHVAVATPMIYLLHASQVSANGVAFIIANICSYLLNTLWSFGASPGRDSYLRFLAVSLVGLGITLGISSVAPALGAGYWHGLAAILSVVPVVTFVLHRSWTYR